MTVGPSIEDARRRVKAGGLRGLELSAWLAAHPPPDRDGAFETLLGLAPSRFQAPIGPDRMGYMPSAIAPVVRTVLDVPIAADDVFVDLGAGLGKVVMAVHLLTGARCRGVDLQADLVEQARVGAAGLAMGGVSFDHADAIDADLGDATVVFLYLPFTGAVLAKVMERLHVVAAKRAIVVCTLGLDLRGQPWLIERPTNEFWLSIYDTRVAGASPRLTSPAALAGPAAQAVAAGAPMMADDGR
jgi:hypothetical protein